MRPSRGVPYGPSMHQTSRRNFLRAAATATTASALGALMTTPHADAETPAQGPDQPNILLVMTDQERGWWWLPDNFEFDDLLPNRARLRRNGLSFSEYHTVTAPCGPARSVLMTGRHTRQTRVFDNPNLPWGVSMPHDAQKLPTIGHRLRDSGYETAYLGKWHLTTDADMEALPHPHSLEDYGFGYWQGHDAGGTSGTEGQVEDPEFTAAACTWLETVAPTVTKPWFACVSLVNPHDINAFPKTAPAEVPAYLDPAIPLEELVPNLKDDLRTKPRIHSFWKWLWDTPFAAGHIDDADTATWRRLLDTYIHYMVQVDAYIGQLLDSLDASGQAGRTVVIFTSDHGELGGAHTLRAKGPEIYRESHNVPFVVVDPRRPELAGTSTAALASSLDVAPTLLSLAGADPAQTDLPGHSLAPVLSDPGASVRHGMLFTWDARQACWLRAQRGFLRGYYDGRSKLGRYFRPGTQDGPLRRQRFELYDVASDPGETRNLARYPDGLARALELNEVMSALIAKEIGRDTGMTGF